MPSNVLPYTPAPLAPIAGKATNALPAPGTNGLEREGQWGYRGIGG